MISSWTSQYDQNPRSRQLVTSDHSQLTNKFGSPISNSASHCDRFPDIIKKITFSIDPVWWDSRLSWNTNASCTHTYRLYDVYVFAIKFLLFWGYPNKNVYSFLIFCNTFSMCSTKCVKLFVLFLPSSQIKFPTLLKSFILFSTCNLNFFFNIFDPCFSHFPKIFLSLNNFTLVCSSFQIIFLTTQEYFYNWNLKKKIQIRIVLYFLIHNMLNNSHVFT